MALLERARHPVALSDSLANVRGIPPRFLPKLKKLGIETAHDLLLHLPSRYLDFSLIVPIRNLAIGRDATVQGIVQSVRNARTWHKRITLTEALISDGTGSIRALWFNQPYLKNTVNEGKRISIAGKVTLSKQGLLFSNPMFELIGSEPGTTTHTGRIIPIYPETRGLTSKGLRFMIKTVFERVADIPEPLPERLLKEHRLPSSKTALAEAHFPTSMARVHEAQRRFAFEELLLLQLRHVRERMAVAHRNARPVPYDLERIKELLSMLPFSLMPSQKKALWEILQDIEKKHPMTRLLQGDVGSGKTIVAAIAAITAADAGSQVAFMAPTEILAKQHYETFAKFFGGFDKGVSLLTANETRLRFGSELETKPKKQALLQELKEGRIAIVFGTHALLQRTVTLPKLALVVIDEQHRFGVEQRAALATPGTARNTSLIPHLLSMSATPIPRTLSLVIFGDLDISLITELPKNRKPIETSVVPPERREWAYETIGAELRAGRQAFVICPRIVAQQNETEEPYSSDDLKKMELKSVEEEFEKLSRKIFPEIAIAMLHGKMKSAEKESTMRQFRDGTIKILVATSVVEVGIDVPNASIMMIESAERFGLAQLYQFRGRVGRGEHQSQCFLLSESHDPGTLARLHAMSHAKNGFELAEQDLKLRGPGEFLGDSQTGMPDIVMKALQNPDLVREARRSAQALLENDPELASTPKLQSRLSEFQRETHWE